MEGSNNKSQHHGRITQDEHIMYRTWKTAKDWFSIAIWHKQREITNLDHREINANIKVQSNHPNGGITARFYPSIHPCKQCKVIFINTRNRLKLRPEWRKASEFICSLPHPPPITPTLGVHPKRIKQSYYGVERPWNMATSHPCHLSGRTVLGYISY